MITLSSNILGTFSINHIQLPPHGLTSNTSYVIIHRALDRTPLNVASGSGISFTLKSGKDIIDAASGPSVACLGHNQPEITKAILDHLNNNIAYAYSGSFFTNDASEELAHQPGGLSKAIFVNSGSEATDAALKLAVQFWHEKGEKKRTHFIARKQSYHGNTIGALCVSGHDSRRELYKDFMSSNVSFVDPCYAYRLKEEVRVPSWSFFPVENDKTNVTTDNVRHGKNRNHACLGARRWLPRTGYTDNRQGPWWRICPSIGCAFT